MTGFLDEIIELDAEHALTKYTWREEDCAGHFPGNPVVPGVKMLEMAAQTAARVRERFLFTGTDRIVFKKMVRPGETVSCRAELGQDGAADVELKFLGGPKDGEIIVAGKIRGDTENRT